MSNRRDEEHEAQRAVAELLTLHGVCFCATLAGADLSKAQRGRGKAGGYIAGEPDIRIYDRHLTRPARFVGMMIEMKTSAAKPKTNRAHRFSGCEPHQRRRLEELEKRGWYCVVGYGLDDAVAKIRAAGYLGGSK